MALGFLEFCICSQYNQERTTKASLSLLQKQLHGRTLLSSKTQKSHYLLGSITLQVLQNKFHF